MPRTTRRGYTSASKPRDYSGAYGVFKSLRLTNFKGYKGPTGNIPLAPLTVIIGQNNAGKSAILHALLLIKQTLADRPHVPLVTTGPDVDLGGFPDIVNGGAASPKRTFAIGITRDHEHQIRLSFRRSKTSGTHRVTEIKVADAVDATFGYDARSGDVKIHECKLKSDENVLIDVWKGGEEWVASGITERAKDKLDLEFSWFFPTFVPKGLKDKSAKVDMRGMRTPFEVASRLESHSWMWSDLFKMLRHVGPVRTRIPWHGRIGQRAPTESAGENLIQLLARKDTVADQGSRLLTLVDKWTSKELQILAKLRVDPLDQSKTMWSLVGDEIGGCSGINVAAMGQGLAQSMPIIAQTFLTSRRGCLLIEQPELHLHPKAQADLADLFIEQIGDGRQFIIETHSEHLLLRVRRRVAEHPELASKVSILFVNKVDGRSTVTPLKMNGHGHFDNWPDGFFDEAYKEAMALAMAQPTVKK